MRAGRAAPAHPAPPPSPDESLMSLALSPATGGPVSAAPPAWYATFTAGVRAAQAGKRAAAAALFRKALAAQPHLAAAWADLGILEAQSGQFGAAIGDLNKAITNSTDPRELGGFWAQLTSLNARAGKWPECAAAARKTIALTPPDSPPNVFASAYFGVALLHAGQYADALPVLRKLPHLHGEPPAAADLRLVFALEKAGQLPEALAAALQSAKRYPKDPHVAEAIGAVGDFAVRENRYDVALAAYQSDFALQPTDRRAGFNVVAAAIRRGRTDIAIGVLKDMLHRDPNDAKAHFQLGVIYFSDPSNRPERLKPAERELQLAATGDPTNPLYITQLGLAVALQGPDRMTDARHLFDGALKLDPTVGMARIGLGYLDEQEAQTDKPNQKSHFTDAIKEYEAVVALKRTDDADAKARRRLAGVRYTLGDKDHAYKDFEDLIARYPDTYAIPTLTDMASLLYSDHRYAEAAGAYSRLIAKEPHDVAAILGLGLTREQLKDLPGAKKQYEAALALEPGNATAALSLGSVLKSEGNPAEAIAVYGKALRANPAKNANQLRLQLGSDLEHAGRMDDALAQYRALTLTKGDPNRSLYLLTGPRFLIAQKRYAEAEKDLTEIAGANPTDDESAYELARAQELNGHGDASEATLRAILARHKTDPADSVRARIEVADLEERLKKPDQAAQLFEETLRLDPSASNALAGLSRIRTQQKHPEAAGTFLETLALGADKSPNIDIVHDIQQLYLVMDRTPDRYGAFVRRLADKYPADNATQLLALSFLLDGDNAKNADNRTAAEALIARMLAKDPTNSDAHFRQGMIRENEGRVADAIAEYSAAIKTNSGYGPARAALTRLGAPIPPPAAPPIAKKP
jgi:tetratricopeptide (TPR) repeat protein